MMSVEKQFVHLKIQLASIISATNNFPKKIVSGKVDLETCTKEISSHSKGKTKVAVKRLVSEFGQGNSEFWKEVIMLSVYRHDNIITLIGFCDEMSEKILVYAYVSNKSLDLHLNNKDLNWVQRLTICIGAARGLAYLHNPANTHQRVLHRDIKSSNVLLDENWNAKIADFGLSKFGPANQQYTFIVSNNVVGTIGYCDPLYLESGLLTKESDVYSFGVVLFEVLCGRLCIGKKENSHTFTQLVRKHYKEDNMYGIIFSHIKDEIHPNSLKAFTTIAYQCLKRDHKRRPLMTEIATQLETALNYQGPEVRSGDVPKPIPLQEGKEFNFTIKSGVSTNDTVSVNYDGFINDVEPGDIVLVDGGMMSLAVKSKTKSLVKCEVIDGGELKSKSNLIVRRKSPSLPSITGPKSNKSTGNYNQIEEKKIPNTPHTIESLNQLKENVHMIEPEESWAGESVDDVEKLKSTLQNVYAELDVEREASATAASEALSMILQLQEEKAKMQMETSQYKRIMEERYEIQSRSFETNQE
ncbi:hypothetical protein Lser_V15G18491 [Lactuca serriola]